MRPLLLALSASLVCATPAAAMDEDLTFYMVRGEIDAAHADGEDIINWDGEGWIGGPVNRFWFKTEGEIEGGETHAAEVQALWSRNVADFWDLQAGVRFDFEPDQRTYLALGVQGLAPYQFETEATAFLSEDGDVSARLRQSLDVHLTQRFIAEPHGELEAFAQDDPGRMIGAGLADLEIGLQLRYEITRKFAPYVDLVWGRALGETASLRRAAGESVERSSLRAGIRFWF
ncbi:MAG: copper resistance protein B [Hyphomonadaceae bacterium]